MFSTDIGTINRPNINSREHLGPRLFPSLGHLRLGPKVGPKTFPIMGIPKFFPRLGHKIVPTLL